MGWFDYWFTESWFGTVSNVTIVCNADTLPTKTTLPPVTVRTDQRLVAGAVPLSGSLTVSAPDISLGTRPGVGAQTLKAALLSPSVRVTTSHCVTVPSMTLNGALSPSQVSLGATMSVPIATVAVLLAPIGVAAGVRLIPDGLGGRWSLPQKGTSVVIEI